VTFLAAKITRHTYLEDWLFSHPLEVHIITLLDRQAAMCLARRGVLQFI
jgi:hypothetical protein